MQYEIDAHRRGFRHIVGIDEAGYGSWAGPVAAGAVCLPPPSDDLFALLEGVRDSKTLSARQRENLAERIKATAITWGVGHATPEEIDAGGIRPAARLAMQRALDDAIQRRPDFTPDCLFLDGLGLSAPIHTCEFLNIKRGDKLSLTVAAASIIGKVWRDDYMRQIDAQIPGYGFGQHKGYGTASHRAALESLGVSRIHRRYYRPIRAILEGESP